MNTLVAAAAVAVLCAAAYTNASPAETWGVDRDDVEALGEEVIKRGQGEFPLAAFDTEEHLTSVKRALQVQTRNMKSCGNGKFCPGTCCGKDQCCKKGWTCRYMPRIRSFYCIP